MVLFFFFKQKTAYEMRISDWSSDVCSSDLLDGDVAAACNHHALRQFFQVEGLVGGDAVLPARLQRKGRPPAGGDEDGLRREALIADLHRVGVEEAGMAVIGLDPGIGEQLLVDALRSEEHTSELQSLMRI